MFIVSWRTSGKQFRQPLPGAPSFLFIPSPARCIYKPLPHSLSEERKIPHENSCLEKLLSPPMYFKALKQETLLHH